MLFLRWLLCIGVFICVEGCIGLVIMGGNKNIIWQQLRKYSMSLYPLFLTFFISLKKNENYGIHTSPVENCGQDKHVFFWNFWNTIHELTAFSWEKKNSFLKVKNSISDAFWLFKLVSYKPLIFLPTFSTNLDCFPVYSLYWKSRGGQL